MHVAGHRELCAPLQCRLLLVIRSLLVPSEGLPLALSAPPCTCHGLNELVFCMCWLLSHSAHTGAGGSKKRGADIAGMPSKRSNLADRLGPAGMSTLAVLLGHDVTQADLDRLQQVGATEAGQAVGPPHQKGQVAAQRVHVSFCATDKQECTVLAVTGVDLFDWVVYASLFGQVQQSGGLEVREPSG